MLNLDPTTEYGARVQRRLHDENVIWLTTVDRTGTPRSVPVWFHWDGEGMLIYSEPGQLKVRNIERNPRVNLHFNADIYGDDIVILSGEARIAPDAPSAFENTPYVEKYRTKMVGIGLTPETFAATYSTAILFTPERLSGH